MNVRFGAAETIEIDISDTGDFIKQCVRSEPDGEPSREGMPADAVWDVFVSDFHAAIADTKQ